MAERDDAAMTSPTVQQLTCPCGIALHVRSGTTACLICERVYTVTVEDRPMTGPEKRIAAAHLRGERLPEPEPTITAIERLR